MAGAMGPAARRVRSSAARRFRRGATARPRADGAGAAAAVEAVAVHTERDAAGRERVALRADGWNFSTWRGRKTHYIVAGDPDAEPLLLVHGFGASAYHWRYQLAELAKTRRVYALCLVGYGWSEKASLDYSTELWGDQVIEFAESVVGKPCVIAGNSIGAVASLYAASQRPDLFKGVALLNAAGRFAEPGEEPVEDEAPAEAASGPLSKLKDLFGRAVAQGILLSTQARIAPILKQVYVNHDQVDDALVESIFKPSLEKGVGECFYRISGSGGRSKANLTTMFSKLSLPCLLLWGMKDPWMVPEKADQIRAAYPAAEFVPLDAGHCPHDDEPAGTNAALASFADRCFA